MGTNPWVRLGASFFIMAVGCGAQYAMSVALLPIQTELGASRWLVSFAYTINMVSFGIGGILMGRLFDRYGAMVPIMLGAVLIAIGYAGTGLASNVYLVWLFYGVFAGIGGAATFAPLIADTALTFRRNRGLAVAICACGNYFAGVAWPPALQHFFDIFGWRATFVGAAVVSIVAILPLAVCLRARLSVTAAQAFGQGPATDRPFGLSPRAAMAALCVAGIGCCVAMAMPQVHLVAYCGQLGFTAQQGAQAVSILFMFGIVSRLVSGAISDRIGGLRTLLLGGTLQAAALLLFLSSSNLDSVYFFSGFFGLVQGGIVPAYAMIVREHFDSAKAGQITATVMMATLVGMALGGFMPGLIFDYTGSYTAAFLHGFGWNIANVVLIALLWRRMTKPLKAAAAIAA